MVAATVLVTITMMNIFIAVLCDAYNKAFLRRDQIFWHTRVLIVLEETLKAKSEHDFIQAIKRCVCVRRAHLQSDEDLDAPERQISGEDMPDEWDYVWYCQPDHSSIEASDGNIDADDDGLFSNKEIEDLKAQV